MSKKKRNLDRPDDLEESESQDGAAGNLEQFEEVLDSVMYEVPRKLSLILEGNVKINEEWNMVEQLRLQLEESCDISRLNQMVNLLVKISQVYDEKLSCVDHIFSCVEDLAEVQRQSHSQGGGVAAAAAAPSKGPPTQETTSEHKMMLRRREEHSGHHYSSLNDYYSYDSSKRRKKDSKYSNLDVEDNKSYLTRSKYDKMRRTMSSPRRCPSPDRNNYYSENEASARSLNLSEHSDQDGDGEESDEQPSSLSNNRTSSNTKMEASSEPVVLYCLCRQNLPEAAMVACDNQHCEVEWFHFKCVDLKVEPKGKWYCPACRINKNTYNKPKPKLKHRK